jgi:hypothetical protein
VAFDLTIPTGGFEIGHFRLGAGKRRVASDGHYLLFYYYLSTREKERERIRKVDSIYKKTAVIFAGRKQ